MTRGRRGSLAFQRVTLSFTTTRRFIPAHEEIAMPRPRSTDGGELVARTLKQFGVEVAFGLHGGHLDSLLIGLHRNHIRLVDTRHEAVAVNAADGYARATGRLGVAFATAASGYSNAIAGLATAYADRSPL